jgi:indolepyruvate ferredoxin oxidoreductase alpha subunit
MPDWQEFHVWTQRQHGAKEFIGEAFDLSEKFDTPVIVRSTTRVSHSKTPVDLYERTEHQ